MLAAWDDILGINYWAIFAIAKDILEQLNAADAARLLRRLRDTAQSFHATGVDNAHDLTGRVFQKLIADRKYLATSTRCPPPPRCWHGSPSPSFVLSLTKGWRAWTGPAPRRLVGCASAISPAAPAPSSRRCTSR